MTTYNKTQLNPDASFERHVYHRDQFSHYLRWAHILKVAKIGQKVLDFGCGTGNLLEVFYRNRFKCERYTGLDIRKKVIDKNNAKYENLTWAEFRTVDLCKSEDIPSDIIEEDWDIITSFEVIEHISKKNGEAFLKNIRSCMKEKTYLYLSTPCYDPKVGAAANHIIDNEVGEFTYEQLINLFVRCGLTIEDHWGTFASQKDYKPHLNDWQKNMFDHLKEYFDSNVLSVIMANFFPSHSRNCIWKVKLQ